MKIYTCNRCQYLKSEPCVLTGDDNSIPTHCPCTDSMKPYATWIEQSVIKKEKCKCHNFYKNQNTYKFCPECGRSLIKQQKGIYAFCNDMGCCNFNHFNDLECDYKDKSPAKTFDTKIEQLKMLGPWVMVLKLIKGAIINEII